MKYPTRTKHKVGNLYTLIHCPHSADYIFNSIENIKDYYSGKVSALGPVAPVGPAVCAAGKYISLFSVRDSNKKVFTNRFTAEEALIGKIVLFLGYVSEIINYTGYPEMPIKANICKIIYEGKVKFINKRNLSMSPYKLQKF